MRWVALVIVLLFPACSRWTLEKMQAKCEDYGYERGTVEFAGCMERLDSQRRAIGAALIGGYLARQPVTTTCTGGYGTVNCVSH